MTFLTHLSQIRVPFYVATALLTLVACSSSSDSDSEPANGQSGISASEHLTERFGSVTSRNASPEVSETTRETYIAALNNFSFNLHRVNSEQAPQEGAVASGYSAAVALAMGAAATGEPTLSSLNTVLGFDSLDETDLHEAINELALALDSRSNEDLILRTANRVFVKPQLALQTDFLDALTSHFGAPVTEADFAGAPAAVADDINGWVSEQTDGFIPKIADQFNPNTVFALLNAIFLDAKWRDEYTSADDQPFTNIDNVEVQVPSFTGRSSLPRLVSDELTAIEIPYGGNELAMLILMPTDITAFEASLNNASINSVIDSMENRDVQFVVPNWQQESELDLMNLLAPLGLPQNPWVFERLVNGGTNLDVIAKQVAKIEVDKDGTRAAAVTLVAGVTSVPESININRPFVYALRDRTSGAILFTGRVVAP